MKCWLAALVAPAPHELSAAVELGFGALDVTGNGHPERERRRGGVALRIGFGRDRDQGDAQERW